jgi:hypothetical protein
MSRGTYGSQRTPPALVGAQRTALPGEDNHGFVDRYTVGHAAFGVLGGLARLPWWGMLASGLVWDLIIERQFKDAWPELFPNPTQDTWQNIAGDTVAMMAGWKLANLLPEGKKPTNTTIVKEKP